MIEGEKEMKINNIEFQTESIGSAGSDLMITFPQKEFTHFFSTIAIDKPLNIEGYEDYTLVSLLTVNPYGSFILQVAKDIDDTQSLEIITGKEFVSITEARTLRSTLEKVSKDISDEDSEGAEWLFPLWNGAGISYKKDDRVQYENVLYKCLQAHTSQSDWTPDTAVSLWVRVNDPREEFPQWVQPTGAHDAYMKGDKVTYQGKHYESTIDNNVYSPTDYPQGWKEVA